MQLDYIFQRLWKDYTDQNPSIRKIYHLFQSREEEVYNDHIAFRTFDDDRISIDVLAKVFTKRGYIQKGEYHFTEKNLFAKHYELPDDPFAPRVFISQLILSAFSKELQDYIKRVIDKSVLDFSRSEELLFAGDAFGLPNYKKYEFLRKESEYAAWLYAFGFRANHFTLSVNRLKSFDGIEEVNQFLKDHNFILSNSGGEIKGSEKVLLKQSSIVADKIKYQFIDGEREIPSCYYEFAERFKDKKGKLFNGFISGSADKIFESTNFRK